MSVAATFLNSIASLSRFIASRIVALIFVAWLVGDYLDLSTAFGEIGPVFTGWFNDFQSALKGNAAATETIKEFALGLFNSTMAIFLLVLLVVLSNLAYFLIIYVGYWCPPRLHFLNLDSIVGKYVESLSKVYDLSNADCRQEYTGLVRAIESSLSEIWTQNQSYTQRIHEALNLVKGSIIFVFLYWIVSLFNGQGISTESIWFFIVAFGAAFIIQFWLINIELNDFLDLESALRRELLAVKPEALEQFNEDFEFIFWVGRTPSDRLTAYGSIFGPFIHGYQWASAKPFDDRVRRNGRINISHGETK